MDNQITINNTNQETENQVLKLYFEPRKWSFNKACNHNVGNRSFITGPDGILAEGYMIGNWAADWTEIVSETLLLPRDQDCSFTFWLNGGENDRNDEVCRFEVVFNNDYEQRLTYNLNRHYIRPVKKLNGWELYEIPFRTQNNEYTELRFVAQKAYLTILAAKDVSAYAELPDTVDPFEEVRPQRHNLIFTDGFPTNSWYSTKSLQEAYRKKHDASDQASGRNTTPAIPPLPPYPHGQIPPLPPYPHGQDHLQASAQTVSGCVGQLGVSAADAVKQIFTEVKGGSYSSPYDFEDILENKKEVIRGIVEDALQQLQEQLLQLTDEIRSGAVARLNGISSSLELLSSTCDMLEDLDVESFADRINTGRKEEDKEELEDVLSDAADSMSDFVDELRDSIEETADQLEEIRDSLSI